ncbi:hypothetical protein Esti_000911 [Eimeria stiedai]
MKNVRRGHLQHVLPSSPDKPASTTTPQEYREQLPSALMPPGEGTSAFNKAQFTNEPEGDTFTSHGERPEDQHQTTHKPYGIREALHRKKRVVLSLEAAFAVRVWKNGLRRVPLKRPPSHQEQQRQYPPPHLQ